MTDAEREADVAKYDKGVDLAETRPLSASERARWERAKAAVPRQRAPDELARILIALDPKLLAKAHARARKQGKTLSALISDMLRDAVRRPATSYARARHRLPA